MEEDVLPNMDDAVAKAKQLNANGCSMGLAQHIAVNGNKHYAKQLASEMGKRGVQKKKWLKKKKSYVRMPPRDWMAEHEANQD